ncbi:hypothetical protein [Arthrobacter sp. MMS18-M83]|uniref:hypothetical protein n=1 Tax=Arthrobacter sp. MMS18-M83 TaxID=2996261 RepID=UPI00227C3CCD|nr:hypothetical protein [Arthrobacter sp. MMS18-M83]WAH99722.1 hypothetical protein OW521_00285 [Arthrobacter sp. MMS18-M83]
MAQEIAAKRQIRHPVHGYPGLQDVDPCCGQVTGVLGDGGDPDDAAGGASAAVGRQD